VTFVNLTVLAPRAVGNTDGIDPESCQDVLIDGCHIDVGDDGIGVKSDFRVDPGDGAVTLVPAARVLVRDTVVLSRNVAIGSATFGNISDVLFVGGQIGDDLGSLPVGGQSERGRGGVRLEGWWGWRGGRGGVRLEGWWGWRGRVVCGSRVVGGGCGGGGVMVVAGGGGGALALFALCSLLLPLLSPAAPFLSHPVPLPPPHPAATLISNT
jgi:hypothetical protein